MYAAKLQTGQSMTEFLIVLPIMLMLLLGAIQFAFIYHAKTTLNYATFESAKAGTLENAQISAMENGFSRGLAPLFTHYDTLPAVNQARVFVRQEISAGHVKIERINPSKQSFDDFAISINGITQIPNDNLMSRAANVGSLSGQTIQDANLLKIRITYCYPLYVPFVNKIISVVSTQCTEGRTPITAQAILRMQTPSYL